MRSISRRWIEPLRPSSPHLLDGAGDTHCLEPWKFRKGPKCGYNLSAVGAAAACLSGRNFTRNFRALVDFAPPNLILVRDHTERVAHNRQISLDC
jgi:hypothetical protein